MLCLTSQRGTWVLTEDVAWWRGTPSEGSGQVARDPDACHSFISPTFMDLYSRPTLVLGSGDLEMPMTRLQPSRSPITNGHRPGLCPYLPS